jgi:hypothetical protein
MNTPEHMPLLAIRIAKAESQLQSLDREIEEIGQPAANDLKNRLDALLIEKRALLRNLDEIMGASEPDPVRLRKLEALLRHIENEQDSVAHDADFLVQAAPTSPELAARAGTRLGELCLHALKRIFGSRPFGESVFVNHTHEMLSKRYGVTPEKSEGRSG